MQITVTYELSLKELQRSWAQKYSMSRRVLYPVVMLVCAAAGLGMGVASGDSFLLTWGVFCLLVFLIVTFLPRYSIAKTAYLFCVPTEATFTLETFGGRTSLGSSLYRWEFLERTGEGKEFFFLYITKQAALPIPKRAFTPDQITAMRYVLSVVPVGGRPAAVSTPPRPMAGV
jgi:hypothetical protein